MSNQDNSRITVNIHDENGEIPEMIILVSERRRRLRRNPYDLLGGGRVHSSHPFAQTVFNPHSAESTNNQIRDALDRVRMMDVMRGFFDMTDMFSDHIGLPMGGGLGSLMEDRMFQIAQHESLQHYETQEKKPNVKITIKDMIVDEDTEKKLKEDFCAICKEPFVLEQKVTTLMCTHILHADCIGEWVKYKSECPVCREGIETTNKTASDDTDVPELVYDM